MILATIKVSGVRAVAVDVGAIPAGIIGAQVRIEYTDPRWDALSKTVVFRGAVTRDVLNAGELVEIPAECVERPGSVLWVGVYGTNADGIAIPTLWADLGKVRAAADPSGDPSAAPALPVWAQLQEQIDEIKQQGGRPGTPGKDGEDGGYYIPEVTQPNQDTIQFDFTPSKEGMSAVEPVRVTIPGSGGNVDFRTDETLTLKDGVLSVNTTNNMEQDNTLPITSAGVFATVGNIEALLKTI